MPTLPTNPHNVGDSGHVNDHNTIVSNLNYMLNQYQQGNKNRIINGNFAVNQRGYVSAANLASGSYGIDRWKSGYTNTSLTFTAAPQGQNVTISTSGVLQQVIERANIPAGSYTLSWTGTATGRVYNSGGTPPSYAASPITVTLDGSANVVVEFTASGATKTLGNVQLEAGTSATVYEYEQIGETLRKCMRYYQLIRNGEASGFTWTTTQGFMLKNLAVTMRDIPTATALPVSVNIDEVGFGGRTCTNFSELTTRNVDGYGFYFTTASPAFNVARCGILYTGTSFGIAAEL